MDKLDSEEQSKIDSYVQFAKQYVDNNVKLISLKIARLGLKLYWLCEDSWTMLSYAVIKGR